MVKYLTVLAFFVFICGSFAQPVAAWEGRISGMGDPAGLVQDESDFLVHPALISGGTGVNYYGDVRFKYSKITKFDYSERSLLPADYTTSGHTWKYDGSLGVAFPLGAGRMGVFFGYSGNDGKLNGHYQSDILGAYGYDLRENFDSYAIKFLYGIPISKDTKIGAELQIAYKTERRDSFLSNSSGTSTITNMNPYAGSAFLVPVNLFQFGIPVDSDYYEASMKASVETMIGPAKTSLTVRGSIPFGSSNIYNLELGPSATAGGFRMPGEVSGYSIGGDLWVRYPVGSSTTLPFLVSFDYKELERDGEGPEFGAFGANGAWFSAYEFKQRDLVFTAGGGVDYAISKESRVAGGLYYSYLNSKSNFSFHERFLNSPYTNYNHNAFPDSRENRITLKLAGETGVSSGVSLNAGINFFYGWLKQIHDFSREQFPVGSSESTKGDHWGLAASLGAVIKSGTTSIEPFILAGLDRYSIEGDGQATFIFGPITSAEYTKNIWSLGAGVSVRF